MEGIMILTQETVMTSCAIMDNIITILIIIFSLSCFLMILSITSDIIIIRKIGFGFFIGSFACILLCIPIDNITRVPDYIKYEVIIDDSVSMNDFMSKYKILGQRGKIYTVKEIEN